MMGMNIVGLMLNALIVALITLSASNVAITTRLALTPTRFCMVITHRYSLLLYCCAQFSHHVPLILPVGFLTSRSFFEVEPCEVTLLNVLAPVAAVRDG